MTAEGMRPTYGELVRRLGEAVDELTGGDLDTMVEPELADALVDLLRRGSQLEAVAARVAARVDASKIWANDGSRSCAAWLARAAARDRAECSALVSLGRALRTMPEVEARFTDGLLSARHVRLLARAAAKVPDHFDDDEAWLVARAGEMSYGDFATVVDTWIACAAPDDAEDDARDRYERRRLNLSDGLHGTGLMDVEFEPVGYETFRNALGRIEHALWEEDWAEARARLGEDATAADLDRSNAQRRYDALIEMANRSAAMPEGARMPVPLVTVHVDHETLTGRICELASGAAVTPGEVLPLLRRADVERAVFGPGNRVIELGRRSRLFVGGTRRAVEIEHPTCTHPACRVPAELCDIDHVIPWEHGGETNPANGEPRCPQHHPGRHRKRPPQRARRSRRRANGSDDDADEHDGHAEPHR